MSLGCFWKGGACPVYVCVDDKAGGEAAFQLATCRIPSADGTAGDGMGIGWMGERNEGMDERVRE